MGSMAVSTQHQCNARHSTYLPLPLVAAKEIKKNSYWLKKTTTTTKTGYICNSNNIHYTSKCPTTHWRWMYCKVRMQKCKSFVIIVIILYRWLRLHQFPSPALFCPEPSQLFLSPTFPFSAFSSWVMESLFLLCLPLLLLNLPVLLSWLWT